MTPRTEKGIGQKESPAIETGIAIERTKTEKRTRIEKRGTEIGNEIVIGTAIETRIRTRTRTEKDEGIDLDLEIKRKSQVERKKTVTGTRTKKSETKTETAIVIGKGIGTRSAHALAADLAHEIEDVVIGVERKVAPGAARNLPLDPQKVCAGESHLYIGIILRSVSNMSLQCSTKPCKQPAKFQQLCLPLLVQLLCPSSVALSLDKLDDYMSVSTPGS